MYSATSSSQLSEIGIKAIFPSMISGVDEINERVGRNLRRLREARGWSQLQVAEKLGWSPLEKSKISAYENGLGFGKDILVRLCDIFEVDIVEFYWTENTPIIRDAKELADIRQRRESERVGIAEMVREAEASWITAAKKRGTLDTEETRRQAASSLDERLQRGREVLKKRRQKKKTA